MKAEAPTRDPQGLRRPRFSFFIFTCQTARSLSSTLARRGLLDPFDGDGQPGSTDCAPLNEVRSSIGANARLGVSRSGAALSDRVYRGVRSGCQRPFS